MGAALLGQARCRSLVPPDPGRLGVPGSTGVPPGFALPPEVAMVSPSRSLSLLLCLLAMPTGGIVAGAEVDREAEERRIRELDAQWVAAVARKDVAAVALFYAPDGRVMPSNAPTARGRAAIAEFWKGLLAMPGISFTFEPRVIKVADSGDLAYDIGVYSLSYDGPRGRVRDEGKYLVVWEKVDGEWKAMADIDNSDRPAP